MSHTVSPLTFTTLYRYVSPCGVLSVGMRGGVLAGCYWENDDRVGRLTALTGVYESAKEKDRAAYDMLSHELDEYFAGIRRHFDIPYIICGTPFQESVWRGLAALDYGATTSYGALAASLGRRSAVRAVAAAVGANPLSLIVPCHRVVGANGRLTGYAGGLDVKQWLLLHEWQNVGQDHVSHAAQLF